MKASKLLRDAIAKAMDDRELFGLDGACPAVLEEGGRGSRVLLVTGDNAGGKSLFCRYLGAAIKQADDKVEYMRVGMDLRTQSGMHRAFLFGEEETESTGNISVKCALGGLQACRTRKNPHILCLDEPDVGLSEGYEAALGSAVAVLAADLPKLTRGVVIVTHSRPIAEALLAVAPHCVRVGDDLRPTREWIGKGPIKRTIADLEGLRKRTNDRYRAVEGVLRARQEEREGQRRALGRRR